MAPETEAQPSSAEAADVFQLMALEKGFIFGDDPHPGGVSSSNGQTKKRRQHHRVNSWLVSQQLDPIHEEFELLPQQPQPWQPDDQSGERELNHQEKQIETSASVSPLTKHEDLAPVSQDTPPSTVSDVTFLCDDTSSVFTFLRKWTWACCFRSRWQCYDRPIDKLTLSRSDESISYGYKWDSLVCSAIILTAIALILVSVAANWSVVPETESRLRALLSFWPMPIYSEPVSVSVPGELHHYMMLHSWAGDRAALIAKLAQSAGHLLWTAICNIRTVAYSFVDDLLLDSPS
jgi:hypothetical protein